MIEFVRHHPHATLTPAERAMLQRCSGPGSLLCEMDGDEDWKTSSGLYQRGLLTAERIHTGTTGFRITEAGHAALSSDGEEA